MSGLPSLAPLSITGPAYQFNVGDNNFTVTASDKAGNQPQTNVTFRVQVTLGSLGNPTRRFVTRQKGKCGKGK